MRFSIKKNEFEFGDLVYYEDEYSFSFRNRSNKSETTSSLLINYLELEVNTKGKLLGVSGYCAKNAWTRRTLLLPKISQGSLYLRDEELLSEFEDGVSFRMTKSNEWDMNYDVTSNWLCVGDSSRLATSKGLEFATDQVAILRHDKLVAILLKINSEKIST